MPADDNLYPSYEPRRGSGRLFVGFLLLVLIAALSAVAWYYVRDKSGAEHVATDGNAAALTDPAGQALVQPAPVPGTGIAATPEALEGRVADLEQRVTRVAVAAETASGYANRAEAIMVAFAARRSLDSGAPLGYLEGQLRLLFGDAQPKAVATVINAAADPVTINKLRAGLDDISLIVAKGDPKEGWWTGAMRTLGSLVVIRKVGEPAPEPEQRLARARRAVEAGQIESAIRELAALPNQSAVSQWLEQARRYNEARRALDVIEAAAILEPRTVPVAPSQAAPATTPAPEAETR